jgi:hypothetical protein
MMWGLVVASSPHQTKVFHEGDRVLGNGGPSSEELADVTKVGGSIPNVAADHVAVAERVRDGVFEGVCGALDDGAGVAEGDVIIGFFIFFFFLLFLCQQWQWC